MVRRPCEPSRTRTNLAWRLRRGACQPHHGGVTTATTPVARLRTLRSVVAGAFFVQGLLFISLTTRLPQVQEQWSLD